MVIKDSPGLKTGDLTKRFGVSDGITRSIEVSVSPIRGSSGQPTGFRGIVRDNTDRKEMEEAFTADTGA